MIEDLLDAWQKVKNLIKEDKLNDYEKKSFKELNEYMNENLKTMNFSLLFNNSIVKEVKNNNQFIYEKIDLNNLEKKEVKNKVIEITIEEECLIAFNNFIYRLKKGDIVLYHNKTITPKLL